MSVINPFKQGPMSKDEAINIAAKYKQRGHQAVVTESFDNNNQYYVFIDLPESRNQPEPSRTYQNKMWG